MQVMQAFHRVDKAFNSVSRTSKSVRMSPIELFAHPTVSMKDLQRRRGNCLIPPKAVRGIVGGIFLRRNDDNGGAKGDIRQQSPPTHNKPLLRTQESHSTTTPPATTIMNSLATAILRCGSCHSCGK